MSYAIWITGLPSSGKTTLANALFKAMKLKGYNVLLYDGDELRSGPHKDLGFDRYSRALQTQRVSDLCRKAIEQGIIPIVALVSPYSLDRENAYKDIGSVIEVYVSTTLAVCKSRDPKGLYAKAVRGEIQGFTGIDDPYEPPLSPNVIYDSNQLSVENGVELIFSCILKK